MSNNNIDFCDKKTTEYVNKILDCPTISFMTKNIIREGLKKDCLDVLTYVEVALDVLTKVQKNILSR